MSTKPNDKLIARKIAADFLDYTARTMAVYDSIKKYDFRPVKDPVNGRVYYWLSILTEHRDKRQKPVLTRA